MAVPDRGADRMYLYHILNAEHVELIRNMTLLPGTGPRHVLFSESSPTKTLMHLVGELDNTINVYELSRPDTVFQSSSDLNDTLQITHLQSASTLNSSGNRTEPNNKALASELAISSDGRFLYTSNRNTQSLTNLDTIAVFSINTDRDQPLRFLGLNSTYGKIPRHFSLSSDCRNQFLAVVNQVTNDLYVFERNTTTGYLGGIVGEFTFGSLDLTTELGPMAVVWG